MHQQLHQKVHKLSKLCYSKRLYDYYISKVNHNTMKKTYTLFNKVSFTIIGLIVITFFVKYAMEEVETCSVEE